MVFIQGIAKLNINIAIDLHLFGECCAGACVAENCRHGSPWDGGSEKRWMDGAAERAGIPSLCTEAHGELSDTA